MSCYDEIAYSENTKPRSMTADLMISDSDLTTPTHSTPFNISSSNPEPTAIQLKIPIPINLTQAIIDADQQLKRLQQDLLVLTSFNENETLHWRPSWFKQGPFSEKFWTLQNPPNVVTERMPQLNKGRNYYTRRMRRNDDLPPTYIKSWDHWRWYCGVYGIPDDFLCEEQIRLMSLGLPRDQSGSLCAPPAHPLYPEPRPLGHGSYILDPFTYISHLPSKFRSINHAASTKERMEVVVVLSNGELKVESWAKFFMQSSQNGHLTEYDEQPADGSECVYDSALKEQGPGRRWSYLPWTREQEQSCEPEEHKQPVKLTLKLRMNLSPKKGRRERRNRRFDKFK